MYRTMLQHISDRVNRISHQLEFDEMMSKERRARLMKELKELTRQRNNYLKVMSNKSNAG